MPRYGESLINCETSRCTIDETDMHATENLVMRKCNKLSHLWLIGTLVE